MAVSYWFWLGSEGAYTGADDGGGAKELNLLGVVPRGCGGGSGGDTILDAGCPLYEVCPKGAF